MQRLVLFAVLALALAAAQAEAAYQLTYMRTATRADAVFTYFNVDPGFGAVAGVYQFDVVTQDTPPVANPLRAYCLDFWDSIAGNGSPPQPAWYNVGTSSDARLSSLVAAAGGSPWTFDNSGPDLNAAAFQMAVWEIQNETNTAIPYNLLTGNFQAIASSNEAGTFDARYLTAAETARKWLEQVNSTSHNENFSVLVPVGGGQPQQIPLLGGRDGIGGGIVPEPSALSIWAGLALIGGALQYRRRKKTG